MANRPRCLVPILLGLLSCLSSGAGLAAVRCVPATHPGPCDTRHATIQEAVDAAAPAGDVVSVASGIYTEQVTVFGKSIALRGARFGVDARGRTGAESEIRHPDGPLTICGDGVVVDGFTLSGATNPEANWAGLVVDGAPCGAQAWMRVENNILTGNIVGLALGGGPAVARRNWIVNNNVLPEFSHGILAGATYDLSLEENRIAGHAVSSLTVYGPAQRIAVSSNSFDRGLAFSRTTDLTITGNTAVAPEAGAILVQLAGDDHRVQLRDNVLRADAARAIRVSVDSGAPPNAEVVAQGNCLVGPGAIGLEVAPGAHAGTLDATGNWWGSASGPSGAGPGTGSAVVDPGGVVTYLPFQTSPTCGCAVRPDGEACDDGEPCTSPDICLGSVCVGGPPTQCDDADECTDDACVPGSGCRHTVNTNVCDDGDPCTSFERCGPLGCRSETPTCMDDNPCTDDLCDPATGQCSFVNDDANACDDGNACTAADRCVSGACVPGAPVACGDDGNPCTNDGCDVFAGCVHPPNTAACSDGNPCTLNDQCSGGQCHAGPPRPCSDGNPCTDDACNPATGQCVFTNDDTNVCVLGSECARCVGGACAPGQPACDDGISCTVDSCDPISGCTHTPTAAACPSIGPCAVAWCNMAAGCEYTYRYGIACRDGCSPGRCTGGPGCSILFYESCGAPWNCGASTCDAATGTCVSHPNVCDDGNSCTADSCSGAGYCVHSSAACDDADPCTDDVCLPDGTCGHPRIACDDGNPCTDDSCVGAGVCVHAADDANSCDDGMLCTLDACVNGACVGTPGHAGEVSGVGFNYGKTGLAWSPSLPGTGLIYDVVRGSLAALPVGAVPPSESCQASTHLTTVTISEVPGPSGGFWYLVRARYSACDGIYGFRKVNGVPAGLRVTAACP